MNFAPKDLGAIGENEFWKAVLIQTDGRLEPRRPIPDDERVDFIVHPFRKFEPVLALQVKMSTRQRLYSRTRKIMVHLREKRERLISHPNFWYFLAPFEVEAAAFGDKVFLAPSTYVHQFATPVDSTHVKIEIQASLEDWAKDRWVGFRFPLTELGQRLEALLASPPKVTESERRQWRAQIRGWLPTPGHSR